MRSDRPKERQGIVFRVAAGRPVQGHCRSRHDELVLSSHRRRCKVVAADLDLIGDTGEAAFVGHDEIDDVGARKVRREARAGSVGVCQGRATAGGHRVEAPRILEQARRGVVVEGGAAVEVNRIAGANRLVWTSVCRGRRVLRCDLEYGGHRTGVITVVPRISGEPVAICKAKKEPRGCVWDVKLLNVTRSCAGQSIPNEERLRNLGAQ